MTERVTKEQVDQAFVDQLLYQAFHPDCLDDPQWRDLVHVFWERKEAYCAQREEES